jgi:membrane associated rhomboid family serine protease
MGSPYDAHNGSAQTWGATADESASPPLPPAPLPPPPQRRRATRPIVATLALIAVNVAVFLYQQSLSGFAQERFLLNWALVPVRFTHAGEDFGFNFTSPRPMTIVTSLFLHSGFPHIALNMFFLYAFGNMVERAIGAGRFLAIYAAAGIASSVACIFIYRSEPVPVVGASGAVYGVLAAYLLMLPPGPDRTKTVIWMLVLLVLPALLPGSLLGGLTGGDTRIAIAGHIGGFIVGGLVMQAFVLRARQRRAAMQRAMPGAWPPPGSGDGA